MFIRKYNLLLIFFYLITVLSLSSCSSIIESYRKYEGERIVKDLINDESKTESPKKENIDEFFNDVNFKDSVNKNNSKNNDFGANIGQTISYDGAVFSSSGIGILYQVQGFFQITRTIGTGDYLSEFIIVFNNAVAFDSISYKAYSLDDLSIETRREGRGIKFSFLFQKDSDDFKSSKLKEVFQDLDKFNVAYHYTFKYSSGTTLREDRAYGIASNIDGNNKNISGAISWPCMEYDWTFDQSNFKNDERFPPSKYANTLKGYVLDKDGNCLSGEYGTCSSSGLYTASGTDFSKGVLIGAKTYATGSVGVVSFMGSGSLCALNDDYSQSGTIATQCWDKSRYLGSDDMRGRVVFRLKKNSFCSRKNSIKLETNYPRLACNIEDRMEETAEVYSDTGARISISTYRLCSSSSIPLSTAIGKWQNRQCVVEDFRCRGAFSNCAIDGKCWWGCGVGNNTLERRSNDTSSGCEYGGSGSGSNAFEFAKRKCSLENYTGALASGDDGGNYTPGNYGYTYFGFSDFYCKHPSPISVNCSNTPVRLRLGCVCDAQNRWGSPICADPQIAQTQGSGSCTIGSYRWSNDGCGAGQLKKEICSNGNWSSGNPDRPEYHCANTCTSSDASASFTNTSSLVYDGLWAGEKYLFNIITGSDIITSVASCTNNNVRVKVKCTAVEERYLWLATTSTEYDKQRYTQNTCEVKCAYKVGGFDFNKDDFKYISNRGTNSMRLFTIPNGDPGRTYRCNDSGRSFNVGTLICKDGSFCIVGTQDACPTNTYYEKCRGCAYFSISGPNVRAEYGTPLDFEETPWIYDDNVSDGYSNCSWHCENGKTGTGSPTFNRCTD